MGRFSLYVILQVTIVCQSRVEIFTEHLSVQGGAHTIDIHASVKSVDCLCKDSSPFTVTDMIKASTNL